MLGLVPIDLLFTEGHETASLAALKSVLVVHRFHLLEIDFSAVYFLCSHTCVILCRW